jgi:hypothetical protein
MPRLTLDADALAAMPARRGRDAAPLRAWRFRLDSDGSGIPVELPGADYLARLLDLDLDAYRRRSAIVARPHGSEEEPEPLDLGALADGLRETLAALPARPDAGESYRDLVLAAGTPSTTFGEYVRAVVRAFRDRLPEAPARPSVRRPSSTSSRTPAEVERERRARFRAEEEATSRYVLRRWQETGALTPGRYLATDLYGHAVTAVERAVAAGRTMPDGSPLADTLRPRLFYAVADDVLGSRTRTRDGYVYTVAEVTS